ncbi:MAG: DUF2087 domain-containing protein [Chloroflexota bacterium]
MDQENKMLTFVKALSNTDRLCIIGVLSQGSANRDEIIKRLNLPLREVFNHLAFLEHVGVVGQKDGVYELQPDHLEKLARSQLAEERKGYVPAPELDEESRRALKTYLNADGTIRQIPSSVVKAAEFRILLDYLIQAFTPGVDYTEREVNTIIKRFHKDTAGLRRDLVDMGLLTRESDGSRYWRP